MLLGLFLWAITLRSFLFKPSYNIKDKKVFILKKYIYLLS